MRSSLKIASAITVNFALLANVGFAELAEITFEESHYQPLQIIDSTAPGGWQSLYGQSSITTAGQGFGGGTSKGLKIAKHLSEEGWLKRPIVWDPLQKIAFIDFHIKPAANPSGSLPSFYANGTQVAFEVEPGSTKGNVWVQHGNDDSSANPRPPAEWFKTAGTFNVPVGGSASSDWLRVTLRHDYQRKIWDLFVNGSLAAVDLGFDGRGSNLEALEFNGSKAGDVLIDQVRAEVSNMLFPDADKDGLPDSWETLNGSNPNLYDRDAIKPGTGKSFLDLYLDSLWSEQEGPGPVNGSTGVGVVGTVPPLSILASHQPVGSLKGALTVGGDGSASYSIPIDIPKGTGGMEPKLALSYSSNAGNGIMGVGWTVSGLQQITRVGSSYRKDGGVDGVDFDDKDRFALDGQRLICVAGVYGSAGSEYRTESDSFSRIKAHAQTGVPGIGYWTVETSSGITATLGDESPVVIDGQSRIPNSRLQKTEGAFSWSVNKVRDTVGNYYRVYYGRDTEQGFPGSVLNQRISSIEYTGFDGEGDPFAPYASVDFHYEDRADKRTFYTVGIRQTYTQRLQAISVRTKDGPDSYENHRYVIGYKPSQQTGRSLLKAVTKVAGGYSIPATVFEWRTVDHDECEWKEASPINLPSYADPDWDSRDGLSGMISPVGSTDGHIHLTGVVWRAIPFSYPVTTKTYLEFEYKPSAVPPTFAMIGLDTDLETGNPPRLVKVVGSGNPPGGGVLATDLFVPNSGDTPDGYDKKVVHIGSSAATTNWLVLVNDDVNLSDGQGESWFRNIRVYEKDDQGVITNIQTPVFNLENQVPQMINNQGGDLGVRFNDFTGDGRADLVHRVFRNKDGGSGNSIELDVYGQTMVRTVDGYETLPIQTPLNVVSGIRGSAIDAPWARRVDLPSVPVDIDADGKVDYSYAKNIFRTSSTVTGHWHGFATWDRTSNSWLDKPGWALPFASINNQNYHRFNHFSFTDLNGDSFPDLLVHLNTGSLEDANGVVKSTADSAWINRIESGQPWLQDDALALPKPLKIVGVAKGELGRRIFDVNADGLPDFVQSRSLENKEVWLNKGNGFFQEPLGSKYNIPINLTNADGDDVGARLIDLNGDGLTDAIKDLAYDGASYSTTAFLNTGDGWQQVADGTGPVFPDSWNLRGINFSTFDKYEEENPGKTSAADVNGDGLVDLVISTYNRNTVFYNTGQDWWDSDEPEFWADPTVEVEEDALDLPAPIFRTAAGALNGKAVGLFTDVDGDGIVDFISDTDLPQPKVWINQCKREVIETVTDGFGSRLEVEYKNLNDPTAVSNSNPPLPAYTPFNPAVDEPLSAGQVEVRQGGDVVVRLKESDGAGGYRAKRYHYGDYRFDRANEAGLGFGWMEVHDEHFPAAGGYIHQGHKRSQTWRQFPYGGRPKLEESFVHVNAPMSHQDVTVGSHLVTRELSTFGELASTVGVGGTIRRIVQTKSVSQKWDLDGTLMAVTLTNQPVSSFDAFGFVTSSNISSLDVSKLGIYQLGDFLNPASFSDSNDFVLRTQTTNTYNHFTGGSWILGRLASAEVTKTRGQEQLTKRTSYAYWGSGLLRSEEIEPNHLLFQRTEYQRDRYGNVIETKVTANTGIGGNPQSRTKVHGYGSYGRFMESETVPNLGGSAFHYSFRRALLIGTTDIDNRTTTHTYDVFGTKIADNFPDFRRSAEITRHASNSELPGKIPQILGTAGITIKWARVAEVSGAPPSTVYLDALGREVVVESFALTGAAPSFSAQYGIKLFDARGREYLSSVQFLGAGNVTNPFTDGTGLWTQTFYDVLDRPYKTTSPDGKSVFTALIVTDKRTLNGFSNQPVVKVEARNKKNIPLFRWMDVDGRLVESKDASNQTTVFTHDIEGRVKRVLIDGVQQLENGYNNRGNRTWVNDRSAGLSSSVYNGFGEVRSSTNAAGETITTAYDEHGRVSTITRKDDESPTQNVTFTTVYRSSSPAKGQVWKVTNPKGYLEQITYGSAVHEFGKVIETAKCHKTGAPTYFTTTSYNALGLPLVETDPGGLQVIHTYETVFGSYKIETNLDGPRTALLWRAPAISWANGRMVSSETLPHQVTRTTQSDLSTGRLLQITSSGLGLTLQNSSFAWDDNGNLTSRIDAKAQRTETFGYDSLDRLTSSQVTVQGGSSYPVVNYSYDANGNLRNKGGGSLSYYDGNTSYRIQSATLKGASTPNRSYQYDLAGRVVADGKRTFGWTGFGQLKRVQQVSCPALDTFAATGTYAPQIPGINPLQVYEASNALATFEFDASGSRSKQILTRTYGDSSKRESITHYVGSYETEDHGTYAANGTFSPVKSIARHQLGSALYTQEVPSGGSAIIRLGLVLTDHLGSTDVIVRGDWDPTSSRWKVTTHSTDAAQSEPRSERQSFDAWGERRDIGWQAPLHSADTSNRQTSTMNFDRGFTGHEMLDDFALVHMNGRIYDPEIGRFLSPDPYVQVPEYSQNFNRYSYVLNNPLSHTDSSGNEIDGLVAAAVAIVVGVLTYGAAVGWIAASYGAAAGAAGATTVTGTLGTWTFATGLSLSWQGMAVVGAAVGATTGAANAALTGGNVLEGALEGAVSGAIAGGLLHGLGPSGDWLTKGALSDVRAVLHVAGHGILGGIRNEVMGGRFMDGFLSAAAGASAAYFPGLEGVMESAGNGDPVGMFYRSMIAGAVGGTASAIGGGKFANGAFTAAFQHLTNSEMSWTYVESIKLISPRTLQVMDPTAPTPAQLVATAKDLEKKITGASKIAKKVLGNKVVAPTDKGAGKTLSGRGKSLIPAKGNVGTAVFEYYVEVTSALLTGQKLAQEINSRQIEEALGSRGYGIVTTRTISGSGTVTRSAKIFANSDGGTFRDVDAAETHWNFNRGLQESVFGQ